jgi:hypothetical protein
MRRLRLRVLLANSPLLLGEFPAFDALPLVGRETKEAKWLRLWENSELTTFGNTS